MGRSGKAAIDGGKPVREEMLSYGRQCVDEKDIAAVTAVLRSRFLTQGPVIAEFEEAFAAHLGCRFAVAYANGTAALHGAYYALGIGPGDELLTTPMTFSATANAALFLGASVRFADVDGATGLVTADSLAANITEKTRAIAVVHYAGMLCDMPRIIALAQERGLPIVEDACHALGSQGWRRKAGCFGELGVFSFHPVKPITTGEGGMAVTDSPALAQRLRAFRTHGIVRSEKMRRSRGPWYYEMRDLGFNYRITDMQAALGLSQLAKNEVFLARRRRIAARYDAFFADYEGIHPCPVPGGTASAYHLYPVLLDNKRFLGGRKRFFEALHAEGIGAQVHYIPVNAHPFYRELGHHPGDTPQARRFYEREISVPLFAAMTDGDIADVMAAFDKVHRALRR